jgi:hypothetical protein
MPKHKISDAIVDRVEKFWAQEAHPPMKELPSRRSLHAKYTKAVANELSWGSFNTIVKRLEESAPKEPLGITWWVPWNNSKESTEDTAYLLKINAVVRAENGRNLYDIEAKWACKLRASLEGVPPFTQWRITMLYTYRELRAYYLQLNMYTDDLDNLVAYRAWFESNRKAYHFALITGLAPVPDLDLYGSVRNQPIPPDWKKHPPWMWHLYITISPSGTHIPGVERHPEKMELMDQVVAFWGRMAEISPPPQVNHQEEHTPEPVAEPKPMLETQVDEAFLRWIGGLEAQRRW